MTHQINQISSPTASDFTADVNFFDVRASDAARPVVPLSEAITATPPPAPRRSWLVGAVAASALVGSLTGIAAFSFYQQRSSPAPNYANTPAALSPPISDAPAPSVVEAPAPVAAAGVPRRAAVPATETPDGGRTTDTVEARAASTTAPVIANTATTRRGTTPPSETAASRTPDVRPARDGERAPRGDANEPRTNAKASTNRAESAASPVRRESATTAAEPRETAKRETVKRETTTRPRRQSEARAADTNAEPERAARPGYVDAVRRAIGDRPANRRRRENADSERVREIFEGQAPPR